MPQHNGFEPPASGGNQSLPSNTTNAATVSTGSGKGSPAADGGGPSSLPAPAGNSGLGPLQSDTSDMRPRNP